MIVGIARGVLVPVLLALASASAGASGARPPVALTASPAHLELAGTGRATVRVTNSGTNPVVLDVRRAGFALDLRGRPKIVGQHDVRRTAAAWLGFRPRTLSLRPGATGSVTIASTVPARAEPGDHDALVLFTTRRRVTDGLAVRVRMGVVVVVRAPGAVVHRIELRALRVAPSGPRQSSRARRRESGKRHRVRRPCAWNDLSVPGWTASRPARGRTSRIPSRDEGPRSVPLPRSGSRPRHSARRAHARVGRTRLEEGVSSAAIARPDARNDKRPAITGRLLSSG